MRLPLRSCIATLELSGSRVVPLKSRRTMRGTEGVRLPGITGEATPAASLKTNDSSSPDLPGRSLVSLMEPRRSLSRNVEKVEFVYFATLTANLIASRKSRNIRRNISRSFLLDIYFFLQISTRAD